MSAAHADLHSHSVAVGLATAQLSLQVRTRLVGHVARAHHVEQLRSASTKEVCNVETLIAVLCYSVYANETVLHVHVM